MAVRSGVAVSDALVLPESDVVARSLVELSTVGVCSTILDEVLSVGVGSSVGLASVDRAAVTSVVVSLVSVVDLSAVVGVGLLSSVVLTTVVLSLVILAVVASWSAVADIV